MTKQELKHDVSATVGVADVLTRRLKSAAAAVARFERDPRDVEALHDFRTALRRFRSVERAFRARAPGLVKASARRRLRDLASLTNEARDIEVLIERVEPHVAFLSKEDATAAKALIKTWRAKKARAYRSLRRDVVPAFRKLATELRKRLRSGGRGIGRPSDPPPTTFPAAAAEAAREQATKLNEALARVENASDDDAVHDARIAAKRLRYVIETILAARPEAKLHLDRARALQRTLGDLRDWRAAEAALLASDATRSRESPALLATRATLAALARKRADDAFDRFRAFGGEDVRAEPHALARIVAGDDEPQTSDVEIERKYLLSAAPPVALEAKGFDVAQGWLPGARLLERIRRTKAPDGTARYFRTIKFGSGVARTEIEEETTEALFKLLWKATKGRRVRKRRHLVPEGNRVWEIDVFRDRDLVLAEIELRSEDEIVAFPEWLAPYVTREVTDEPAFLNANLAR